MLQSIKKSKVRISAFFKVLRTKYILDENVWTSTKLRKAFREHRKKCKNTTK